VTFDQTRNHRLCSVSGVRPRGHYALCRHYQAAPPSRNLPQPLAPRVIDPRCNGNARKPDMTDRRKAARESALRVAMIEFRPVGEARCMIRNISSTGALLEMGSRVALPNKFVLAVLSNHTRRHCRVVWRDRNRLGVAFDGLEYPSRPNPVARGSKPRRTDTSASIESLVRAAIANSAAQ
jgi:hypothetical protein